MYEQSWLLLIFEKLHASLLMPLNGPTCSVVAFHGLTGPPK